MLKQQRTKLGLTLNDLATKMGTDRQYIWNIENGKVNFTIDYLDKLLYAMNCNSKEFIKG